MESNYIDLGLSVKWCSCNVGAEKPEEKGDLFLYQEAKEKFGRNLPTIEQWKELQQKCTIELNKKKDAFVITGPNENSIIIPITYKKEGDVRYTGSYFWSSDLLQVDKRFARFAYFNIQNKAKKTIRVDTDLFDINRQLGLAVRTVKE